MPGDIERLEFADDAFDAVICMGVLEYLPAYGRALSEICRVLRDPGIAVLSIPNRVSPYHLALLVFRLDRMGLEVEETRVCGAQYIVKARKARP